MKLIDVRAVAFCAAMLAVFSAGISSASQLDKSSLEQWKTDYVRPGLVPFPEDNPYTVEKADLGKKLFFDPRLSGSNAISCASCHNPAFSWGDGLAKGVGHGSRQLGRRTPTIWNLAWAELLMWDGRFETLEEQALGPMAADVEMAQDMSTIVGELSAIPGYRALFNIAFPDEGITIDTIAKAIATYERTVVTGIAPFDRWVAGDETAIPEEAKRGFALFNSKANCVACHSGWNFTDDSFHDIGLNDDDPGRAAELPGVEKMRHAFKTPTLRNIDLRAPFMHDGSLTDLAAVVRHYNAGGIQRPSLSDDMKPLGLTPAEESYLVAFMETLTSPEEPVSIPLMPR